MWGAEHDPADTLLGGRAPPSPTTLFPTVLFWVSQLGFVMPCNSVSGHYEQRAHQKARLSLDSRCRPALLHAENPSPTAMSSSVSGTTSPRNTQGAPRACNRSRTPNLPGSSFQLAGSRNPHKGFRPKQRHGRTLSSRSQPLQHPPARRTPAAEPAAMLLCCKGHNK